MKKIKIDWKDSVVQLVIVTLGILIAFALNSWNETRKEKKLVQLYLEGIHDELLTNKKELEQKLEYHEGLLKSLEEDPLNVRMQLRAPQLNNAAWQLSENDIFKQYIDQDLYKRLVGVYQLHETFNAHIKSSMNTMNEINIFGPMYLLSGDKFNMTEEEWNEFTIRSRRSWTPIFQDWVGMETVYLIKIEDCIKEIEK